MTATWTANRTWTAGELITASIMNQYVRDNLDWLKTPISAVDNAMAISTTSTSLVDVTGSSISLTTTGTGGIDIYFTGEAYGSGVLTMTLALLIDGAAVVTFNPVSNGANQVQNASFVWHQPTVTAGSHTIKLQTKTNAGTVTITGTMLYAVERGS